MKGNTLLRHACALFALGTTYQATAQFTPVALAPESFSFDIVVEKEGPHPFTPASNASFDGGTNNTGFTLYEMGYNLDNPESGFPAPGSTVTSETAPDHSFVLAPSYTASNAILIDTNINAGTFTFAAPAAYASLSFLASSGNGAVVVGYTLRFTDGTSETGSFTSPDWFGGAATAITANGRVNATAGTFDSVGSGNPRIYSVDVTVANSTKVIRSVDLTFNSGGATGHAIVFGVSGSNGAEFTSINVTGYNRDVVVEAGASRPAALNVTTASMDGGAANTGSTWYERGYNTAAPATGLPLAGSAFTNVSAADHLYRMPASYSNNNAAVIDAANTSATLTLSSAASYSAISLLGSSGSGAVTLDYAVNHTDGSVQSGSTVIPDWFNVDPYAFTPRGRVNVENGNYSAVNTENPRLYAIDIAIERTTTPIASITLNYNTGNGHATILALSAAGGVVRPIFDAQPSAVTAFAGSPAELVATVSGTGPVTFRWFREVNGSYVSVANNAIITGADSARLNFSALNLTNLGNYVLVASNPGGSSTSLVTRVTVLSNQNDVTSPTDEITAFGGTSPDNEPVANAFDNTTTKYLNFGLDDTAAPYVGPVGAIVTPALGSTVVTGLRIYTANDAVDRDPADYRLEGSSDAGQTYTLISSGPLTLPAGRNAGGLDLDPLTQPVYEVNFPNTAGYTTYRISFTNVKNNAAGSMQVGELELLGTQGTGTPVGPTLRITRTGSNITITWDGGGTLQATPSLTNPVWATVLGSGSVTLPITGTQRFFRVVR